MKYNRLSVLNLQRSSQQTETKTENNQLSTTQVTPEIVSSENSNPVMSKSPMNTEFPEMIMDDELYFDMNNLVSMEGLKKTFQVSAWNICYVLICY